MQDVQTNNVQASHDSLKREASHTDSNKNTCRNNYLVQTSAGIQFYMDGWQNKASTPEQREDARSCPPQA